MAKWRWDADADTRSEVIAYRVGGDATVKCRIVRTTLPFVKSSRVNTNDSSDVSGIFAAVKVVKRLCSIAIHFMLPVRCENIAKEYSASVVDKEEFRKLTMAKIGAFHGIKSLSRSVMSHG